MHLLMLTPSLPYPPHQGGALRNYGLLHGLRAAGHQITLLSFDDKNTDISATPLDKLCIRVETVSPPPRTSLDRLRDLVSSTRPDLAHRLMSADFQQRLIDLLSEVRFDLVQFEGLEMAAYLPVVRQQQPNAKLCYDAHNAEYQLQQMIFEIDRRALRHWPAALYSLIQSRRIAQFERTICQQADCVLAVSEEDAQALRSFNVDTPISVVPNGIFTQHYDGKNEQLDLGGCVLTFTGKMDYRPNIDAMLWFTSEVFPHVLTQIPHVMLYIVGQNPHPRLEHLRDHPKIALTGWVADVQPFLNATQVYIAPLRMGSGTRLKILEAMATGCAVVATSLAAAGLPAEASETIQIVDSASTMADAIVSLLRDNEKQQQLGLSAQAFVRQHYDWSVLIPRLLTAYRTIGLG